MDELLARRTDLYVTTHNNHFRQTSMPPAGFERTVSPGERPQTYALDHGTTGTVTFLHREEKVYIVDTLQFSLSRCRCLSDIPSQSSIRYLEFLSLVTL